MPAICKNVRKVEGADFVSRTLVYDKSDRSESRRAATCPRTWKTVHTCPEPDQPGVINAQGGPTDPGPTGLANPTRPRADAGAYEIKSGNVAGQTNDAAGQPSSGLQYSCDEYPPAKLVFTRSSGLVSIH